MLLCRGCSVSTGLDLYAVFSQSGTVRYTFTSRGADKLGMQAG